MVHNGLHFHFMLLCLFYVQKGFHILFIYYLLLSSDLSLAFFRLVMGVDFEIPLCICIGHTSKSH